MTLEEFVKNFAEQFDETPIELFAPSTEFKELDEWGSLTALSVITMVNMEMGKRITGANLKECKTIQDLYNFVAAL